MFAEIALKDLRLNTELLEREEASAALDELVSDISQHGLLQPLCVRPTRSGPEKYEVFAGKRRFKALQKLGATTVPCKVQVKADNVDIHILALAENFHRTPLSVVEKCKAVHALTKLCGGDPQEAAQRGSLPQGLMKDYIKMRGNLSQEMLKRLDNGQVPFESAFALSQKIEQKDQERALTEAGPNLKTLREWAKENGDASKNKKSKPRNKPWIFDDDGEPLLIPEHLYAKVLQLVKKG